LNLPSLRLTPPESILGRHIFYGWWIVAGMFGLASMVSGFFFLGFSAFVIPLTREFDVGRDIVALVFGVSSSVAAIFALIATRLSPRVMTFVGILMMGVGFLLLGRAGTFLVYACIQILLVGVGGFFIVLYGSGTIINNWFNKKRGLAFAIGLTGMSFGALLVSLTRYLIDSMGWRDATLIIGVTILTIGLPIAAIMRTRPEDQGLLPDGDEPHPGARARDETTTASTSAENGLTVRQALATQAFWVVTMAFLARSFVTTGLATHFIPAIEDKGFSAATGAAMLSIFALMTIPSRLAAAYLGDRWRRTAIAGLLMALMAVSMAIMVWAQSLTIIVLFVLIYSLAWGGIGGAMALAIRGEFFGRRHFAAISGATVLIIGLGEISGPFFAGFIFEETGTYRLAYVVFTIVGLLSAAGLLLVRSPLHKNKRVQPR